MKEKGLTDNPVHFFQNWIAYQTLQNAAKLESNQQIVSFPNDEQPKAGHYNAFCQVTKNFELQWSHQEGKKHWLRLANYP